MYWRVILIVIAIELISAAFIIHLNTSHDPIIDRCAIAATAGFC